MAKFCLFINTTSIPLSIYLSAGTKLVVSSLNLPSTGAVPLYFCIFSVLFQKHAKSNYMVYKQCIHLYRKYNQFDFWIPPQWLFKVSITVRLLQTHDPRTGGVVRCLYTVYGVRCTVYGPLMFMSGGYLDTSHQQLALYTRGGLRRAGDRYLCTGCHLYCTT